MKYGDFGGGVGATLFARNDADVVAVVDDNVVVDTMGVIEIPVVVVVVDVVVDAAFGFAGKRAYGPVDVDDDDDDDDDDGSLAYGDSRGGGADVVVVVVAFGVVDGGTLSAHRGEQNLRPARMKCPN